MIEGPFHHPSPNFCRGVQNETVRRLYGVTGAVRLPSRDFVLLRDGMAEFMVNKSLIAYET